MLSISNADAVDVGDRILDAAAGCVVDFGVDRVTLAEIARRAGVSRPTVYRRWPDTRAIIASLLTARITGAWQEERARGLGRTALVDRIVAVAERLRHDRLVMSVLRSAPELAMVYITLRPGWGRQALIDAVADDIAQGQRNGSVRSGDPRQLAAMVLLIAGSTTQSAKIVEPILGADELAAELAYALNGYLT